ncbi:cytochrome c oxidase subunit II [Simiduia agarivorans]|uniref:Cytochrome c oxidase subunit 2 n=1 Tax=Simiduia agarivorans (strain DSM 21679 / JCM 13881 / BCRC 17597 / SA1) TaxID=1117647 RepID=K4KNC8_SIMAS|nr:cytochrome c oxidase subunit II [Simiduia agarivorans]AFU99623.2 cytochrome c oxidase subunit II [Simiduia agarivorans SA1 = DSM 21679]
MLKQAKSSFACLLGLTLSAPLWASDEVQRWGVNMTEGVTDVSQEIYGLHMDIFWWCVGIGVVVFGVMFYTMIAHRKSNGAKAANFHESLSLELAWTFIPIVILVVMAWPATKVLIKIYDTSEPDIDIVVTGYQWKWKYEYLNQDVSFFSNLSTPADEINNLAPKNPNYLLEVDNELVIPVGKKVRFLITANDVIHAWWVPDLAVKKDAIPGFINESWTRVNEPGIYRGQCAELCGKDHGFMPIVVRAVEQAEFETWMDKKREAAAAIAEAAKQTLTFDELYAQGEAVYVKHCAACHQADGKGIPPTFPAIAGSPIANGDVREHLNRVINGGQGMPPFGEQLTPVESAAVITFQRNAFGNNTGSEVQPIDVVNYQQGN